MVMRIKRAGSQDAEIPAAVHAVIEKAGNAVGTELATYRR
jgi:hypothetical protein